MDVDTENQSNVDDWLVRFSPSNGSRSGAFPFNSHKIQSIESRRARLSDLLIFDILLISGGIRNPDMLFPPTDWPSLRKLLGAIDQSVYDILKKDCLVYILLKWAWDMDTKETNSGWDARYLEDRCIAPQFAALADAYWLLDTGTHLVRAVSILADARLNRDHVSKILQALALSSSPASLATGTAPATAALIVNYVRTAKPLLTEPDDIDLYAISLARLSFMDAWAYQKSFPEGSDTRERLLGKIVGWSLMPTPKQEPLTQLVAIPLSSYEQSALYSLALPSQSTISSSNLGKHTTTASRPALSSHAMSILQDLLCVRAIQSGQYVRAIKLDREFSSVTPSLANGASSSSIASQTSSTARDTIDRKSIIQDLFATLPPAERILLEDEIGKVAAGVRAHASLPFTQRQGVPSSARRPLVTEPSLSASWEDVGARMGSPAPSRSVPISSPSVVGAGFASKGTPAPVPPSVATRIHQSPFASLVARPQQTPSAHQIPPKPKFTAFGSPIPSSKGTNADRSLVAERGKMLFATSAARGPIVASKIGARISLFETAGSAKNAPNAFYKPPPALAETKSVGMGSVFAGPSAAKSPGQATHLTKQNGKAQGGDTKRDDEDVNMGSGSDAEIVKENHKDESNVEEQEEGSVDEEEEEDDAGNFITQEKGGAADLTFHPRHVDEAMSEDDADELNLTFSVFSGSRNAVQSANAAERKKSVSGNGNGNGRASHVSSPPRARVSPLRDGDKSLSLSVNSSTASRRHALPGAFHPEEEEDDDNANETERDDDDRVPQTKSVDSPHRSTRTRTQQAQAQTPPRTSVRSEPRRASKGAPPPPTTAATPRRSPRTAKISSSRPKPSQPIPGSLMGEDEHEHHHGRVDDEDTEMEEREEEEEDAVAPLPAERASRRTRISGTHTSTSDRSTTTTAGGKSKDKDKDKGKTRSHVQARRSLNLEPKIVTRTPVRRSSRLSIASSMSPELDVEQEQEQEQEHKRERERERVAELASPTKKGRKSVASSRTSMGGSGSVPAVATRSSTRRKQR